VGEPTPEVEAVSAAIAKNLANFDDLDLRVTPVDRRARFTRCSPAHLTAAAQSAC
jgi:hypothetical protein